MANRADDPAADAEESEWRFSLEDIEEMQDEEAAVEPAEDEGESGGNIAGSLTSRGTIEPGTIDRENALFVVLGVLATLLVFVGFYVTLL